MTNECVEIIKNINNQEENKIIKNSNKRVCHKSNSLETLFFLMIYTLII